MKCAKWELMFIRLFFIPHLFPTGLLNVLLIFLYEVIQNLLYVLEFLSILLFKRGEFLTQLLMFGLRYTPSGHSVHQELKQAE